MADMKGFVFILCILFTIQATAQSERKFVRRGNREFDDKKYQEAEIQYRKALEKSPSSAPATFNLGNAQYRQKQFDAAAKSYAELAGKGTAPEYTPGEYYNLGNALYKSGKYKECIEAYKNALKKSPGDMDAKHNLQLAMRKLQQQQQQQEQQQNKNQQNKDQKNNKDQKGNNKDKQDNKNQQNKDQNKDQDNKQAENNRQNQKQNVNGQISQQDADRILQALENEEKNVLKRVQEQNKQRKSEPVDKNW
jgi:Ca-activated chloride channel homolog